MRTLPLIVALLAASALPGATRAADYGDLAPATRQILDKQGIAASQFPDLIQRLDRDTGQRLRDGESDHLVYYILQSMRFTHLPRIEPALSAREFMETVPAPGGCAGVPAAVKNRMRDFLKALDGPQRDERLDWFRKSLSTADRSPDRLCDEYARAARSLYRKEFGGAGSAAYQSRGHSSDTRIESSYAVAAGIQVLKALDPAWRVRRVLVVGPGLDFAPRTDLIDSYPPQSYQPYAIADALLADGAADLSDLRIDCVDINPRVIGFFREFPLRKERSIIILQEWSDPEYNDYFRKLGRRIGTETPVQGGKTLRISQPAADMVAARQLNVITQREQPAPQYDLIVATNVLVYFSDTELLLALDNLQSMLAPGGILIHNELRPEVEQYSTALDFGPVQARTLRLSGGSGPALFDSVVIHRKRAQPRAQE